MNRKARYYHSCSRCGGWVECVLETDDEKIWDNETCTNCGKHSRRRVDRAFVVGNNAVMALIALYAAWVFLSVFFPVH